MAVVRLADRFPSAARAAAARDFRGSACREYAVFDLDRTLVPGSSLVPFGRALVDAGLIRRRELVRRLAHQALFAARGLGPRTLERLCTQMVAAASGRDQATAREIAHRVAPDVVDRVYGSALWLLAQHRSRGDGIVLLSAGPQELVEAVAAHLLIDVALGTQAEVVDGSYTGALASPFCHGEGKVHRLRTVLSADDMMRASAYGDSESDLPVLRAVGRPVAVNPDRGLLAVARTAGWPIVRFV